LWVFDRVAANCVLAFAFFPAGSAAMFFSVNALLPKFQDEIELWNKERGKEKGGEREKGVHRYF
jgi:hypothetical protein